MSAIQKLLTDHIGIWTGADAAKRTGRGRASGNASSVYGIKKLRELILELAVRGKLVPQDANDEPAIELLKRIQAEKEKLVKAGRIKKDKPLAEITKGEKPFELPSGWIWTTLASVAQVNPRNDAEDNLQTSFVPMTMIGATFNSAHEHEARLWKEIKQGFTHFAEGDVGVAKITPCFENSKACVFSGLINGIGAGTTELHIVRPVQKTLDPRYVLAYLKSPQFLLVGEGKMTGTAGQKRLPKEFVESNPFPLPPLVEQHRIVAKIDELMALCDQLETQHNNAAEAHEKIVSVLLQALTQSVDANAFADNWQRIAAHFDTLFTTESSIEALKKTLLQLAVMGKLVPQDASDEPASELIKKCIVERKKLVARKIAKYNETIHQKAPLVSPYAIPFNWEWVRFKEVIWCFRGHNPPKSDFIYKPKDGYVRFIQITDFKTEESAVYVPKSNQLKMVYRGEIIMAAYRHIGKLSRNVEGAFNVALCKITEFPPMNRDYLELLIGTDVVKGELLRASERGHIPSMHSDHLLSLYVPIPPEAEQQRIVAKVDELMALCDQLKTRIGEAGRLQQKIADVVVEGAI